jgi:hypothetical protein
MDTDPRIEELRAKHPNCAVIPVEMGNGTTDFHVYRYATSADYARHRAAMLEAASGRTAAAASFAEMLARGLCVVPGPEGFDRFRADNPAAASDIGSLLIERAGGAARVTLGKL